MPRLFESVLIPNGTCVKQYVLSGVKKNEVFRVKQYMLSSVKENEGFRVKQYGLPSVYT